MTTQVFKRIIPHYNVFQYNIASSNPNINGTLTLNCVPGPGVVTGIFIAVHQPGGRHFGSGTADLLTLTVDGTIIFNNTPYNAHSYICAAWANFYSPILTYQYLVNIAEVFGMTFKIPYDTSVSIMLTELVANGAWHDMTVYYEVGR